jgi:hypothetical protein
MGDRCVTCSRPVAAHYRWCFPCERHREVAAGYLADSVACVGGAAVRGQPLAIDLWRYKSESGDESARGRLRLMLLRFLRDSGPSVWAAAGMERGPQLWTMVPTGRGRFGDHPLAELVGPCLRIPRVSLAQRPDAADRGRDLDPTWLQVLTPVHGRDLLVLDDTWVTGGSAQSTAVALKLAGAAHVAIVVLGRHVQSPRVLAKR